MSGAPGVRPGAPGAAPFTSAGMYIVIQVTEHVAAVGGGDTQFGGGLPNISALQALVSSIAGAQATPVSPPHTVNGYAPIGAPASRSQGQPRERDDHGTDGFPWDKLWLNPNEAIEVDILDGEPHVLPTLEEGTSAEGTKDGKDFTDFVVRAGEKGVRILRVAGSADSGGPDAQRVKAIMAAEAGDAAIDELMRGPAGFAQLLADAQRAQSNTKMDVAKWARTVATITKALGKADPEDKDRLQKAFDTFKELYDGEGRAYKSATKLVTDLRVAMGDAMRPRAVAAAAGGGSRKRRDAKKRRGAGSRKIRRG